MKKSWIFLVAGLLLACVCPSLPALGPSGSQDQSPTEKAPTSSPLPGSSAYAGFTQIRLYPENGDLVDQLQVEAGKARALGQHMFVEFDALW